MISAVEAEGELIEIGINVLPAEAVIRADAVEWAELATSRADIRVH